MSSTIWSIIIIVFVVVWAWLLWEAWNTPIMPDDYDTKIYKKQLKNKKQ